MNHKDTVYVKFQIGSFVMESHLRYDVDDNIQYVVWDKNFVEEQIVGDSLKGAIINWIAARLGVAFRAEA